MLTSPMTINRIIAFLLCLALLGVWFLPPPESHAQVSAQDACFARFQWNTDDPDTPYWQAPLPANLTGGIDLRSLPQAASPGPLAQGWGLFAYDRAMGTTGMHCLGGNLDARFSAVQADTIAVLLGQLPGSLQARDMRAITRELLSTDADPTGQDFAKPVRISREQGFKVEVGGFGTIIDEEFSRSHPAFEPTLAVRWADYRQARAAGVPLEDLQRWTGYDALQYYGSRNPTSEILDELLPPEHRGDGSRSPATTIGDTFTELVLDTNLESHVPSGPNAGTGWAIVEGTAGNLVVNALNDRVQRPADSGRDSYRMTDALSSDDHYAQANSFNGVNGGGGGRFSGVTVRVSSSAATYYSGQEHRASETADPYTIWKVVAGTPTELGTLTGTGDNADNLLRLEANGSALDLYGVDGTQLKISLTDTSITGNLHVGIAGDHTGTNRNIWDNFKGADLAAAPAAQIIVIDSITQFLSSQTWLPRSWAGLGQFAAP
jgi:hypothetical protein